MLLDYSGNLIEGCQENNDDKLPRLESGRWIRYKFCLCNGDSKMIDIPFQSSTFDCVLPHGSVIQIDNPGCRIFNGAVASVEITHSCVPVLSFNHVAVNPFHELYPNDTFSINAQQDLGSLRIISVPTKRPVVYYLHLESILKCNQGNLPVTDFVFFPAPPPPPEQSIIVFESNPHDSGTRNFLLAKEGCFDNLFAMQSTKFSCAFANIFRKVLFPDSSGYIPKERLSMAMNKLSVDVDELMIETRSKLCREVLNVDETFLKDKAILGEAWRGGCAQEQKLLSWTHFAKHITILGYFLQKTKDLCADLSNKLSSIEGKINSTHITNDGALSVIQTLSDDWDSEYSSVCHAANVASVHLHNCVYGFSGCDSTSKE